MGLSDSLASTNKSSGKVNQKAFSNGKGGSGKLGGMMDSASGINHNVAGTVVGVGNIVAKAAGALGFKGLQEKLTGSTKISYEKKANEPSRFANDSGLRGFYTQFGGQSQKNIERIDPLNTFVCEFKFYPNIHKITNVTAKQVTRNEGLVFGTDDPIITENNFTIGKTPENGKVNTFLADILNNIQFSGRRLSYIEDSLQSETEVKEFNESFEFDTVQGHKEIFKDTYITTTKDTMSFTFDISFSIYIQRVTLPQIEVQGSEEVTTLVGKFPVPGNIVVPSSNSFSMDIINTNLPVLENVFYPWMRETTLPIWSYDTQPFTTADITFDFTEHANFKYHFFGCRPTQIFLLQPEQQPLTNPVRQVQFVFDFMTIETDKSKIMTDSVPDSGVRGSFGGAKQNGDSKTNLANSILFSAANTLRL